MTMYTLTGDFSTLSGAEFPIPDLLVWIEPSYPIAIEGTVMHLGRQIIPVTAAGTFTISVPETVGGTPLYQVHAEFADLGAMAGKWGWDSGWFTVEANNDLANIVVLTPTRVSPTVGSEALAAAAAAEQSAQDAADAANAASAAAAAIAAAVPTPPLPRWYADLARRGSKQARVVVVGDSISEGQTLTAPIYTKRWVDALQRQVRYRLNLAAASAGYMPAVYADVSMSEETTRSGGAVFTEDAFTWGLGGKCLFYPSPGVLTWPAQTCDRVRVWYGVSNFIGGTFKVYIDGVDKTNTGRLFRAGADVGAAGAEVVCLDNVHFGGGFWWESAALTDTSHTVDVRGNNAVNAIVCGVEFLRGDLASGVHVYDCTHSGAFTWGLSVVALETGMWMDVAALDPGLVLLNVGSNDAVFGATAADYQGWLTTLIGKVQTYAPHATVLIVKGYKPGAVSDATWVDFRAAMDTVAATESTATQPVVAFDLFSRWPLLASDGSNSQGLMTESPNPIHPNAAGHQRMTDILTPLVAGP